MPWEAGYFLDISGMSDSQETAIKMEALLDKERLLKVQAIKEGKARALAIGAGLLLRLAYVCARGRCETSSNLQPRHRDIVSTGTTCVRGQYEILTPEELLEEVGKLPLDLEPRYCIGAHGKPYFQDEAFFFSLSHSEELVLCAVSDHEIGVDVQMITGMDWKKLADRFYSEEETVYLQTLSARSGEDAREEFFRLWCRKEAYGKMTGKGAAPYLNKSFLGQVDGVVIKEDAVAIRDNKYHFCVSRSVKAGI